MQELDGSTLTLIVKALLHQGFMLREVFAAIMMVFLGSINDPILNGAKATGRWYSQQVSGNKGHGLGSPLPHVIITILKFLKERKQNLDYQEHVFASLEKWTTAPQEQQATVFSEILDVIPVFRISKAYTEKGSPQQLKVYLRVTDDKFRQFFLSAFESEKLVRKQGVAPRTALERLLQTKLEKKK